jgi:RNA polymerase sigma-70 factor (ECF subfamily)
MLLEALGPLTGDSTLDELEDLVIAETIHPGSEIVILPERTYKEKVAAMLEPKLVAVMEQAAKAWPGVRVEPSVFLAYVAERIPGTTCDRLAEIDRLHAADLYLACACVHADRAALSIFDKQFLSEVSSYVQRRRFASDFADEVVRALRYKLLVAQGDGPPRIATYSGRGPLSGWMRMCATRAIVDLVREQRGKDETPLEDETDLKVVADDAELAHLKQRYRSELGAAFQGALSELSTEEANTLRMHFLEGMSTETIARLYRVSARTIQRRIALARQSIIDRTRRILADQLGLSNTELDSMVRLLRSEVDVSISRFLKRSK